MTIPFFDGHNDTLLRLLEHARPDKLDMFIEGTQDGHIDLPRARSAGMVGGFFAMFPPPVKTDLAAVAASPMGDGTLPPDLSIADALKSTNGMTALLLGLERAGALAICRSAADIRAAIAANRHAAIFHIEGAEAVDTDFQSFELLYAAGLRSIGITWSRANAFGTGVPFRFPGDPDIGPGLTEAGKELVRLCDARGVMIDLSHLNAAGFRDVAAVSTRPLVATHSNVHAICASARNLTDWQLGAIRDSNGMVGLNFAVGFLNPKGQEGGDADLDMMVRHIDALLEALGEDGVGLGSDFDGAPVPFGIGDVTGLPKLIAAFEKRGYGRELIEKIAWKNWVNVLERTLGS